MTEVQQRRTRQRETIWLALQREAGFASAQQIHESLQADRETIGLATIYRTLKTWQSEGLVDVIRGESGENLYRACSVEHHHHHIVCTTCGVAAEFTSKDLEDSLKKIARSRKFNLSSHAIEMFGQCERCHA